MENHRNRGPCFFFLPAFFLQLVFAHSLCLSCYMGGSISFVVGSLQGWEDREWLWLHANRCLTCTIPVILKPSASRCKIVKCKRSLEQLQAQVIQTSTYLWVWCHIEGRHALMPWTTSNLVRHPWFRWTLLRPMKGKQASGMQIFHLRFARRITLPETNGAIAPEHGWDWKTILSFWDVATLAELLVSGSVLVLTTCIWQGFTGIFPSCQFLIGVTGFWEATFMVHESGLGWRKAGTNTPPDSWGLLEHFCPAADFVGTNFCQARCIPFHHHRVEAAWRFLLAFAKSCNQLWKKTFLWLFFRQRHRREKDAAVCLLRNGSSRKEILRNV